MYHCTITIFNCTASLIYHYIILYYNIIYNIYIILPFSPVTQIMKTQMVQWYNGTKQCRYMFLQR